ncbi:hypothetical protein DERP_015370 [Dermatophagoides pteronyssinus]|uniref:Uncharacterized protein n=1 Tax=Dermatophagoides pteronyssinus TaxID=6956 RepID=A0ABQ8J5U1_DERPT|nr:hypothetical protein DERP_015370 [Dermatophagoides pteronyssinus]
MPTIYLVKEDEPQPSTSNISLNDELEIIPSTSTLTTTITPVDEDITGAIGQDHLNDYNEFMMMNNEQEREQEESDSIIKLVPMVIKHCLSVLPNDIKDTTNIYENMITLSQSNYFLNQFIELLPSFVPPVHEKWPSKNLQSTSPLKFSWVQPSEICDKIFLNNKFIVSQLLNETSCNFDQLKYTEHLKCDINRRKQLMGELIGFNRAEMKRSGYELKDVLKPLIDDLKFIMEEGIEKKITDINGQTITKKFKIAISAVCGDNKGIYELLGYHTAFTSRSFICRLCGAKAKDNELNQIGNLIDFAKIDYQKALVMDKAAPKPSDKAYGLQTLCAFVDLPNINISNLSPLDCMHDLDEGVLENIIFATIKLEKIEIPLINTAMQTVSFKEDKVKIIGSHRGKLSSFKIKGTAASKYEFFVRFDEILSKIPHHLQSGTDAFTLYNTAKDFAILCHRQTMDEGDIAKLKNYGQVIVDSYSTITGATITPKFHNILHYWQDAKKYGPIYRNSSYKYERVHQNNKRSIASSKNLINPSYSMINYSQRKISLNLLKMKFFEFNFYENSD